MLADAGDTRGESMAGGKSFTEPTGMERFFNGVIGFLVGFGIGPRHMRVLEVRGRKTGRRYSLPVDLLPLDGKLYLVAPRGRTQWVQNAEAQGEVVLRRGGARQRYRLRALAAEEKPKVLKAYLDTFKAEVGKFFPVSAGSPTEAFATFVDDYPSFELLVA